LRHFQHTGLQSQIGKLLRYSEAVSGILTIFFVSVHGHTPRMATLSFGVCRIRRLVAEFDIVASTSDIVAAKQRARMGRFQYGLHPSSDLRLALNSSLVSLNGNLMVPAGRPPICCLG
jgi:hypothetical protein